MGLLQKGKWVDQRYDTDTSGGEFRRQDSRFRNWLTPDGEPGPNGARIQSRERALPFVCVAGLPLGTPRIDISTAEAAAGLY